MKKKFLIAFWSLACSLVCALGLVGCGTGADLHEHSSQVYIFNISGHWKVCDDCGNIFNMQGHDINDIGICTVCDNIIGDYGFEFEEILDASGNVVAYKVDYAPDVITQNHITIPSVYDDGYNHSGIPVTCIKNNYTVSSGGHEYYYGVYNYFDSITIPSSVTSIESKAFVDCKYSVIYCEAKSKPSGWSDDWNCDNCPVIWDCKNNDKDENGYAYANINGMRYSLKDGQATVLQQRKSSEEIVIPSRVTYNDNQYGVTAAVSSAIVVDGKLAELVIYCEAKSKPSGWSDDWNYGNCPVVWDCKNNDKDENGYAYANINGMRYSLKDGQATIIRCIYSDAKITLPSSVTYKDVAYSVTSIGDRVFYYYKSLKSIEIPSSVTSIGASAFSDCSGLTSITIPNSVTSIGEYAFFLCSGLTSITISNSVASIGGYAFARCSGLTSITIPNSVTSIGEYAFSGCSSLTSIEIPSGVTRIGNKAFNGCNSLETVYWNATSCTTAGHINSPIFNSCTKLTAIVIGDNVTNIPAHAFSSCDGLTSIEIPSGVKSIGINAFYSCSSLTIIKISDSVTSIGSGVFTDSAYYNNQDNWENGILYIGKHLIKASASLSGSYAIKEGTLSIGEWAFFYCEGLTTITIPDSVTSIGEFTFSDCTGLTHIVIPGSVKSIGEAAFRSCSSLMSITFNGTKAQWKAISKGLDWNLYTSNYYVACTDGKLDKNGNNVTE